mmetsp:Transcript_1351/g.2568  ORF Transcript_1351/g.2568 Transcript_1351/m.2568 type:complete len:178 (-) Transcript_1351:151-684(-)
MLHHVLYMNTLCALHFTASNCTCSLQRAQRHIAYCILPRARIVGHVMCIYNKLYIYDMSKHRDQQCIRSRLAASSQHRTVVGRCVGAAAAAGGVARGVYFFSRKRLLKKYPFFLFLSILFNPSFFSLLFFFLGSIQKKAGGWLTIGVTNQPRFLLIEHPDSHVVVSNFARTPLYSVS